MYHVVETLTLRSPFDLIVEDLILHAPTADGLAPLFDDTDPVERVAGRIMTTTPQADMLLSVSETDSAVRASLRSAYLVALSPALALLTADGVIRHEALKEIAEGRYVVSLRTRVLAALRGRVPLADGGPDSPERAEAVLALAREGLVMKTDGAWHLTFDLIREGIVSDLRIATIITGVGVALAFALVTLSVVFGAP